MTARKALAKSGINARDAMILLAHAWGIGRASVSVRLDDVLPDEIAQDFARLAKARAAGRPVSKLIGQRAFWKHDFLVNDDVLDPRPETETLIEQALRAPFKRVLDLGTGSGCILLSLLGERAEASGVGADISEAALNVARRNADALGLSARVVWQCSDWFAAIDGRFDLIVSNPPYIAADEMDGLTPEVRLYDPEIALTPGGDGLDAYRMITAEAADYLAPDGRLMVEIGPTQAEAVSDLMREAGFEKISTSPDLDGRDRVVSGRKA
ncbi:MAG: peptide chain release factor N(5)-glutamine methyltransferase [Pseudomonadota bacterium]